MKKIVILAALSLGLSGCAVSPDDAQKMSTYELCEKIASSMTTSNGKGNAVYELRSRRDNCDVYDSIQAAKRRQDARTTAGLVGAATIWNQYQQTQAAQAAAAAASRPVTCTSFSNGRVSDLVCN